MYPSATLFYLPPLAARSLADQLCDKLNDNDVQYVRWPADQELRTIGFDGNEINPHLLEPSGLHFRVGFHERILPAVVINLKVAAKVKAVEEQEDRKVGAKERRRIREDLLVSLISDAPVQFIPVECFISRKDGLVLVGTDNAKRAEMVLALVRQTLGTFPCIRPLPDYSFEEAVTDVLQGDPAGVFTERFALGNRLALVARDKSKATFRDFDLNSQTVIDHLSDGLLPVRVQLVDGSGEESIELDNQLVLHRIRLSNTRFEDASSLDYNASRMITVDVLNQVAKTLCAWLEVQTPQDVPAGA